MEDWILWRYVERRMLKDVVMTTPSWECIFRMDGLDI